MAIPQFVYSFICYGQLECLWLSAIVNKATQILWWHPMKAKDEQQKGEENQLQQVMGKVGDWSADLGKGGRNLGSGWQTSVWVCLRVRVQTCPTLLFGPYYLSYTFPFCKTKSHVVSWTFYILSHLFVFEYTILWSAIYLLIQLFPFFSFSFFESQLCSKHFFCCWV